MQRNTSQGDCHNVSARLSLSCCWGFLAGSPSASVFRVKNTFISVRIGQLFLKVGFGELFFLYHLD